MLNQTKRAVCPELDNVIAHLELMPLRRNAGKRDKISDRQRSLARQMQAAGLLREKGYAVATGARPAA
jgi:hypothetical protein